MGSWKSLGSHMARSTWRAQSPSAMLKALSAPGELNKSVTLINQDSHTAYGGEELLAYSERRYISGA